MSAMRGLLTLVVLAVAALGVAAQAEKAYKHPLTDMPPTHDAVETASWFPGNPKKEFPAGQLSDVAIGFHNGAAESVNISAIMGSLNSPFDFSYHVQNFSYQIYDARLQPGEEVSLEYQFMPYAQLQPREFTLALTVFYHTDKTLYSTTFYNTTVDIVEASTVVDTQLIFLYLMFLGLLAGLGYVIYSYLASAGLVKKPKKKVPSSTVQRTAAGEVDQSEWLKGTAYDQYQRAKAKRASKAE